MRLSGRVKMRGDPLCGRTNLLVRENAKVVGTWKEAQRPIVLARGIEVNA